MAAAGLVQELCEELTCPICLDYLEDPVILPVCGHNFCRACLARSWRQAVVMVTFCPVCKQTVQPRNLRPNRQLANVVEIAKKHSRQRECGAERKGVEGKGRVCEKHLEPLKLFCRDDEAPICVVCDRSKEHREHRVVPVEEAAQEYKDKLHGYLEVLRKERGKILAHKADTEKQSQGLLQQTGSVREKSVAEFRKLRQFLEEQEQLLLTQMEEVETEIARERDEHLARLSGELSSLESLIQEMQEKIQQPANELLQDVKSILKRLHLRNPPFHKQNKQAVAALACTTMNQHSLDRYEENEGFGNSVALHLDLMWRVNNISDIKHFLEADLKQFKDSMASELQLQKAANVTLNPDTAHPRVFLSEDWKSMSVGKKAQRLPNNPERFDEETIVLGREGFTSGEHFWEVTVGCDRRWAVGVARKSVKRKGVIIFSPEEGIWAVGKMGSYYIALSDPQRCELGLSGDLKRIRVALDCARKRVDFFDPDTAALLYRFSGASFRGETLFPFFYMFGEGYLSLSQNCSTGAAL